MLRLARLVARDLQRRLKRAGQIGSAVRLLDSINGRLGGLEVVAGLGDDRPRRTARR